MKIFCVVWYGSGDGEIRYERLGEYVVLLNPSKYQYEERCQVGFRKPLRYNQNGF